MNYVPKSSAIMKIMFGFCCPDAVAKRAMKMVNAARTSILAVYSSQRKVAESLYSEVKCLICTQITAGNAHVV